MPRQKQIKITKDDLEGSCLESSLPAWERNGWTRADDGSSDQPAPSDAPSAPAENQE